VFANTQGDLCEATGSNVFIVRADRIVTPPPSAGCLLGVTRALLLELCEQESLTVEERAVPVGALADADEAFLTSTTREVQPIAHVDGRALPAAPGPVGARLADAFRALVRRTLDP
jgi:branched-chain amino acid aminotransferase